MAIIKEKRDGMIAEEEEDNVPWIRFVLPVLIVIGLITGCLWLGIKFINPKKITVGTHLEFMSTAPDGTKFYKMVDPFGYIEFYYARDTAGHILITKP